MPVRRYLLVVIARDKHKFDGKIFCSNKYIHVNCHVLSFVSFLFNIVNDMLDIRSKFTSLIFFQIFFSVPISTHFTHIVNKLITTQLMCNVH